VSADDGRERRRPGGTVGILDLLILLGNWG
jgi:hypothetical protein